MLYTTHTVCPLKLQRPSHLSENSTSFASGWARQCTLFYWTAILSFFVFASGFCIYIVCICSIFLFHFDEPEQNLGQLRLFECATWTFSLVWFIARGHSFLVLRHFSVNRLHILSVYSKLLIFITCLQEGSCIARNNTIEEKMCKTQLKHNQIVNVLT